MKQFKQVTLSLALAGLLSAQAQAGDTQNLQVIQPLAAFSEADISTMFVQTDKPMQLAVLSQQEMKETEGAYWPLYYAGIGGAVNGIGYYYNNPNPTWGGLATAVGTGALGGAVGSITRPFTYPIWGAAIGGLGSWAASHPSK